VVARRAAPALTGVPVVVVERGDRGLVVRSASAEARAEGVAAGQRRREAEAHCPGLEVVETDLHAEARAFEGVARAVEQIAPRLTLEEPGRLTFPTRGPARYFGGDEALAARVLAAARDGGATAARGGIADGAFAATLAAGASDDAHIVPPGGSAAFLAPLSVNALGDPELADLLARLGLRTLGAFAALPAPAVLARFGADGRRAHRLAAGLDEHPTAPAPPPPEWAETLELDPPATRVDEVAFAAKALADALLGRLADRGFTCTRVVVEAETEHGEHRARAWRHEGLDAAGLATRVRWQLDGWVSETGGLSGALTLLRLVPDEVVAAGGRQLGFWGEDPAARARADRALARVQGMLDHDAVVTPVVQGGRTPAERVNWVPWGEPREPVRPPESPWPGGVPPPAPARVFDPPSPAELLDGAGAPVVVSARGEVSAVPASLRSDALAGGGGPIVDWSGPWPHDVRWWDHATRRRRALWRVTVATGAGEVRGLVALERGRAVLDALYD
jgi:protein ImuB